MSLPVPEIVQRAVALARAAGFPLTRDGSSLGGGPTCSRPDAGRVLALLAAFRPGGRFAEIGTGTGMGSAWLTWGMSPDARLVTVEIDPGRAAVARQLLGEDRRVTLLEGDAAELLPAHGPFDLLFLDGKFPDPVSLIELLAPGGALVMDDVTPIAAQAPDSPFRENDPKRVLFSDPRLRTAEFVLPDLGNSVLVGVRAITS